MSVVQHAKIQANPRKIHKLHVFLSLAAGEGSIQGCAGAAQYGIRTKHFLFSSELTMNKLFQVFAVGAALFSVPAFAQNVPVQPGICPAGMVFNPAGQCVPTTQLPQGAFQIGQATNFAVFAPIAVLGAAAVAIGGNSATSSTTSTTSTTN
ncbi:hypothetical protein [Paenirhodobacter sp. CAU 1674]|uniref:hypothetical protein n=1 Tax=Paenirhodobacter sp. CAU 1674 TaxID=3032596 RepID=UPI0023DB1479|nr:hypothetical protein [Paenirhodobacter sp. CAU 1674]MDF2143179.1 hypothetical protein [Paenirhodobacter sp. CAU 1674]